MILLNKQRISIYLDQLQRICYARFNLSQKDVSQKLDITESAYSRILTGVVSPRIDTFLKLIDFFTERLGKDEVIAHFCNYVLNKTTQL